MVSCCACRMVSTLDVFRNQASSLWLKGVKKLTIFWQEIILSKIEMDPQKHEAVVVFRSVSFQNRRSGQKNTLFPHHKKESADWGKC